MKSTISIAAVLLASGLQAASADQVTYDFTGMDSRTGTPVLGSFSYQTNAVSSFAFPLETDIRTSGNLTMTYLGHTYSSTSFSAILQPDSLQLLGNNYPKGEYLSITLASSSAMFTNLSSLPGSLNPSILTGSTFSIGQGPAWPPPPGTVVPDFIEVIASGPITVLDSVSEASTSGAPEPSSLFLAALGATAVVSGAVRLRRRSS